MARLLLDMADALDHYQSLHLQMISSAPSLPPVILALAELIRTTQPELFKSVKESKPIVTHLDRQDLGNWVQNGHGWAEPPYGDE